MEPEVSNIAQLLESLTHHNEEEFWASCEKLSTAGEKIVPILLEELKKATPQVKFGILYTFEKMKSSAIAAVPTLIELVNQPRPNDIRDPEYQLNAIAASALGEIGDQSSIPCLIDALSDSNFLCVQSALALGKIGNEHVISPLVGVLQDKNKFWVPRGAAAVALGNLGKRAEEALPALEEALLYDYEEKTEKWDLRAHEAVEDAIQKIKNPAHKSKLTGHGYRFEMWGIY